MSVQYSGKKTISLSVSEGNVTNHPPPLSVSRVFVALFKLNILHYDHIFCAMTYWSNNITSLIMTIAFDHAHYWQSWYLQDGLDLSLDQIL